MSLERWNSRHLRADNTSVIVAYFDPPGTSSESLTREGSTVSNASTVPTSDVVCNLSTRFDDVELDPSFYDDVYASPPSHNNHGRHRKHAKKGTAPLPREIGVPRPWPLAKSDRYRHKKLQGSARTGHKVQPFVLKKSTHYLDGTPLFSSNGTPYKVLVGRPDAFVPASSADITVAPLASDSDVTDEPFEYDEHPDSDSDVTVEPCEWDKHLGSDSGRAIIAQPRSISAKSPYKTDASASGCGSRGVRQVASNITNSSHCLHNNESSVESEASETKHEQVPRGKSEETSADEETPTALVSPMWPRSMGSAVSEKPLNRCRKRKSLRKAGKNENEGDMVKRKHSSGACRPLKRRRTDSVKSRLSKTVIHRTRLHAKTIHRSS